MDVLENMFLSVLIAGSFGLWKKNYWAFIFMMCICFIFFGSFSIK